MPTKNWHDISETPDYQPLTGAEAAARLDAAPETLAFSLYEVMRAFGISGEELRQELASGRLIAKGKRSDTGAYYDVSIPAINLMQWMVLTNRRFPEPPHA